MDWRFKKITRTRQFHSFLLKVDPSLQLDVQNENRERERMEGANLAENGLIK